MNPLERNHFLLLALHAYLENLPELVFFKDAELNYVAASRSFSNMVGYPSPEALIGKTDFDLFHRALAERYTQDDRRVLREGETFIDRIEPLPDADGQKKYSCTSKYALRDETGHVVGLYGVARDVTAQVELEEERECRSLSRQMFEGVLEADVTEDRVFRIEGSVWAKALGLVKGSTFSEATQAITAQSIHPEHREEFSLFFCRDRLLGLYREENREFSLVTRQTTNGESYKWVEFKSRLYFSQRSNTIRLTTVINDLDEEIRNRERLKLRAEMDALTGLLNRESVVEQINGYLSGCGAGRTHALLFVDLDRFKQVNDTLGHPFGDKVLQKISERLKQLFCRDALVGRVGGDEFLVLLKEVSPQEAEERASSIFEAVPFYQFDGDKEIYITCSVGVAMCPAEGRPFEELYAQADKAMYRAKALGKNRLMFYTP